MHERPTGAGEVTKLSVVVPTRNRPASLRETVGGLLHQRFPRTCYEIIVVDDGSDRPLTTQDLGGVGHVSVVRIDHGERSLARNRGAQAASGDVLLFVDDDMRPFAGLLQAHRAAHATWPGCLAVGAIRLPDALLEHPFGRFRQALEGHGLPRQRGLVTQANFASAANMSILRERFLALGGFDPALASAEDQDLALRHSAAGGTIAYLPDAVAVHDDSVTSLRAYCRRHEWGAQNAVPFVKRYPDWPENRERMTVNGPVRWREDSPGEVLKKAAKRFLSLPVALETLFASIDLVESRWPSSPQLPRLYRLALGVHLQRGFRRGWARQGGVVDEASRER